MHKARLPYHLSALAAATLVACGGSDDPPPPPPVAAAQIHGTVAIGAAVAAADVAVTDTAGTDACTEPQVVTNADGEFDCTLKDGLSAPFMLVVTDPSGGIQPMVSVGNVTPAAGEVAIVNVTPLTTAIVAQLSGNDDALDVVADRGLLDTTKLAEVKAKVLAQLAPALAAIGAPAGFDAFTSPLVAATPGKEGNAGDRLIESLRFSQVQGQLMVAPADQPDAAVPVADAATTAAPTVPAPSAAIIDLQPVLREAAVVLNECFSLPVASRVLAKDDSVPIAEGGPEVTQVAPACEDIADDAYLHNGYRAGQHFYAALNDPTLVGAVFQVPELMLLVPDEGGPGAHRAVINLRYRDSNGTAGSIITVARRLAQAEAGVGDAGEWRLSGNRQQVDTSIQPVLNRREQLAPNAGSGSGPFSGAANSRFDAGLNLFINKDGPGSAGLRAARVKGPGLPPAGVVLTPLDAGMCSEQNWMNIRRKDGQTDPVLATPSTSSGSNLFYLNRTMGLSSGDATTRRPNPFESGSNNTQFVFWAHPLDYGQAIGSTDYIDFSQLRAMSKYLVELYYQGESAPRYTYEKRSLTPVVPATSAVVQQWVNMDAATRRLLDPADALAAAADQFALSWQPNPLAETVSSAGVYTFGGGASVNQGRVPVTRGASSAVALAPAAAACNAGALFTALTADGSSSRNLQLRLRTLDGRSKFSFLQYN